MDPFLRLVKQRPDPEALFEYRRELERPLHVDFSSDGESGITWQVGPELSRDGTYVKYVARYHAPHEGSYTVVLHVREGELEPQDKPEGTSDVGAILSSHEWYEFGADLVTLRDAGLRLSWDAAQWVYEAARAELVDLHHRGGKTHGAITARHIRFALFDRPYNTAYLPRHEEGEVPAPLRFVSDTTKRATAELRAVERSVLASAIAQLTMHPDPQIDQLLRDPSAGSHEVLRDLLLERTAPVEQLLRDCCRVWLRRLPLRGATDETIDGELRALWHKVLELDPMIDTSDPAVFDLERPT